MQINVEVHEIKVLLKMKLNLIGGTLSYFVKKGGY